MQSGEFTKPINLGRRKSCDSMLTALLRQSRCEKPAGLGRSLSSESAMTFIQQTASDALSNDISSLALLSKDSRCTSKQWGIKTEDWHKTTDFEVIRSLMKDPQSANYLSTAIGLDTSSTFIQQEKTSDS